MFLKVESLLKTLYPLGQYLKLIHSKLQPPQPSILGLSSIKFVEYKEEDDPDTKEIKISIKNIRIDEEEEFNFSDEEQK